MASALPAAVRDRARLDALRASGLLDSPSEPEFDRFTRLAARLLGAPVALVSLVDEERQYFKSCVGLPDVLSDRRELPLSHSFCQYAVASRLPLVIEDARIDPRLRDNPLVTELGVVAYAGAPLAGAGGQVIGTFCVIDMVPRQWTGDEVELLTTLAAAVSTEIELRATARAADEQAALATAAAAERDELLEHIPEALLTVDAGWRVLFANRRAASLLGRPREELDGSVLWSAFPALVGTDFERGCRLAAANGAATRFEAPFPPLPHLFEVHAEPRGGVLSVYFRDITARRRAEAALRERDAELQQAQKMEAIGQLAGGVAHDFNNLLTVIRAHGEFLTGRLAHGTTERDDASAVVRAADRATELTRQLLAFSRRQSLAPRPVRPADLVTDLGGMLRRLIGADVVLEIDARAPSGWTVADPSQLTQVVLNLAVNARDAMPAGGTLTIAVRDVWAPPDGGDASEGSAAGAASAAGDCVAISVRDTGSGMSPQIRHRIFEPFFTTKEAGRGTGLGLSMVYGIVRQSGGRLHVESAEGVGTTITVLLPRAADGPAAPPTRPDAAAASPVATAAAGGARSEVAGRARRATVLVVEDEDEVRGLVRQILTLAGHEVLEARNGAEGDAVAAVYGGAIDLLLTDVVMPQIGGRELAARIRAARPETRVLYMTGYAPDQVGSEGRGAAAPPPLDAPCLEKPFTVAALQAAVRERLAAAP